ncbi:unnamed protein product [Caretta caretta]
MHKPWSTLHSSLPLRKAGYTFLQSPPTLFQANARGMRTVEKNSCRTFIAGILPSQEKWTRFSLEPMNFSDSGKRKRADNCSRISQSFVIFASGRRSGQYVIGVSHTHPCWKRHWLIQTRASQ